MSIRENFENKFKLNLRFGAYFLAFVGVCYASIELYRSVQLWYRQNHILKIETLYQTPPYGRFFPNVPSWGVIWYQLERMDCQSLENFAVQQGLVQLSDQVKSPKDFGDFQCLERDILRNTIFDRLVKGYLVSAKTSLSNLRSMGLREIETFVAARNCLKTQKRA